MTLKATSDQSIFDIALIAFQDISKVYDLITGNIDNINSEITGVEFEFTQSFITDKEQLKTPVIQPKVVTISNDSTLFDLSLQYYGGIEFIYDMITQNGFDSVDSDPTGQNLIYTDKKTLITEYFKKTGIQIKTKN